MIATRTITERNTLRTPAIRPRAHRAALSSEDLTYAPALSFPRHATAQGVIDALRMMRPGDESVYYLFVTGEDDRLVGVVSLRQVVTARPETRLDAFMSPEVVSLPVNMAPAEQAHLLAGSGFLALPVVDREGRLVGSLDATELLHAVEEGATEGMFRLAGLTKAEALERPYRRAARARSFWLAISLVTAFVAAAVVSRFAGVIAHATILAAFIPLMAIQGNNAGTQTLTLIVRSLTLGTISFANVRRVLLRELMIGTYNGLGIGLLAGLISFLWQGSLALGVIVGLALLGNLILAALAGVAVPLGLKLLKRDPALGAAIVVTLVTNVGGLGLLLGLGAVAVSLGYL